MRDKNLMMRDLYCMINDCAYVFISNSRRVMILTNPLVMYIICTYNNNLIMTLTYTIVKT